MKRRQPEFLLQCVIADYLRAQYPSLLWFAVPNGEKRSAITGARLKRMGVRAGVADILVFWGDSYGVGFNGLALELKAGKGTLQDTQELFRYQWQAGGGGYAIIRSLEDLKEAFKFCDVPKATLCPPMPAMNSIIPDHTRPRGRK